MNCCRNCKEPVSWNYCPNCGQPANLKKIDKHYIIQELGDFFLANRGMVYTIKKILVRPGESVRQFITEDRYRFVKPITFLLITALFYALVNNLFNTKLVIYDGPEGMAGFIMRWLIEHSGYFEIIIGLFVSFWIKIFFRKAGYNIFEIFILFCFVFGITTLFNSIVVIIQGITHLKLISISIGIRAIYVTWATGQFFDRRKAANYIKAFLSYIVGVLTFSILIAVIAMIETVIKH